ncbi:uracil-DNA glycosylase family protein [Haloarculaceae archaeon H-GB2-1]|nr:uracil-DNA glycosylase family protein [Haloarculaceae archaeon H-GB1-1]MEA5388422.1 uracil-DNA glycosylase family protein [Haloarculaceae archaeon H-GB11]MEA5406458.1 uracil-DNA glycosylase family protein [Haloarculaceae archaeon H-GB2-1]
MAEYPAESSRNPLTDECVRCPTLVDSRDCISWGNGPLDASVVVVGEAPAAGDPDADRWQGGNRTGMAYTSRRSGRKVRDLCADAGLDVTSDCYFTNAVKCHPPNDRDPTDDELVNCRSHLVAEMDLLHPDVVLTTGKHATRSVLAIEDRSLDGSFDGFLDAVLDSIPMPTLETSLVPVVHPSYQEVWIGRLGHTYDSYVAALGDALADCAVD